MKKQIANIITSCRILGSFGLLFCRVFSDGFYVLYLFCGLTDMVDGSIARKTGTVSSFGARLDTVADFLFVIASFVKLVPGVVADEATRQSIMEHCRKHIAKYAMPNDIEFKEDMPKTLVGKVAYRVLEEEELKKAV